ncbi:MAG: hypothetical protein AVDCRST_MAG65-532, partial [uncultured Solirubrobacteraceae bacterium]
HPLDRADLPGHGPADRAAAAAAGRRGDPRHLPHARQCERRHVGDNDPGAQPAPGRRGPAGAGL